MKFCNLLACLPANAIVRKLVNVMKELKDAALQRPEDFYEFGILGEPAIVFPFVMGLHSLKEDFKEDLHDLGGAELFDWWDVLCELKKGLYMNAEQRSQEGQPVLEQLKETYECGDFVISSIEEKTTAVFSMLIKFGKGRPNAAASFARENTPTRSATSDEVMPKW